MKDPRMDGVLLVVQSVNNELAELKALVHNQLLMLQAQAIEIDTLKKEVKELERKAIKPPLFIPLNAKNTPSSFDNIIRDWQSQFIPK